MYENLTVGTSVSRTITVDSERTIDFMGEDYRVYATPCLLRDIEHTCRDMIIEHIPDGQDSVGTVVSIAHIAPTLLGMEVTVTVKVAEVDGRKVVLEVSAADSLDKICKGSHERFIVDVDKTRERLKQKAARLQE